MKPKESDPPDILNPTTGETLRVLRSSRSSAHAGALFEITLPAGSAGSPLHFHSRIRERFSVVRGALNLVAGDPKRPVVLGPREEIIVEPGTTHRFWNASDAPVTFECEVSPSRDFETFLLAVYQIGREGLAGPSGMPRGFRRLIVLLNLADFHFPGLPGGLQRAIRRWLTSSSAEVEIHQFADKLR